MKNNAIIIFHLSTGDNFTSFALVLNFYENYENIHIFSLFRNYKFVKQLYKKYPKIIIHILDEKYNYYITNNNTIIDTVNKLNQDCDIIRVGEGGTDWNKYIGNIIFYRTFYLQAGLDYEIRYKYTDFERNNEKENENYNLLINKYGKKYIFLHDHRNIFYDHYCKRKDINITSDIPIFHPNINYYSDNTNTYYNLWDKDLYFDNILDYCKIIENATELHLTDSSFSCLCPYLNLNNVSKKYIYTKYNIIDYHRAFNDWIIINV